MGFGRLGAGFFGSLGALGGSRKSPPTLSAPTITAFTDVTADISVSTDTSGGTLYWVIDTSATPPSKAQVKAGQGSGGGAAASSGNQAVAASGVQTKTGATGLSENTTYYAYFMQETTAGQSNVSASASFTTYYTASQTIFAAFTTPPVVARKAIINTCVGSLKTAGVWTALDVLYLTAAADSQAARINWKNPGTFTALAVNSPTFAADLGYTGDGASSRLRTQFTPSVNGVNYTQNSASIWAWSLTNVANNGADAGSLTTPNVFVSPRDGTGNFNVQVNDATSSTVANANSASFNGASRVNSTTKRRWQNGAQLGTDISVTSTGVPAGEQWICGVNSTSFSVRQIACAAWGASLSGNESAFYNAIQAYLHSIGAV